MRLVLGFLFVTLAAPLMAQTGAERGAITGVIGAQIEAFLARDAARAFTYASPGIQALFGSPERFAMMVEQGYPMVWQPEAVDYLYLREQDGRLWQRVRLRDGAGAIHVLDYQMIETPEGWKINAVDLLRLPEVSA